MSFPTLLAIAVGIIFFAAFVRSMMGFGDALLAMPLLNLLVGVKVATPLVALVSLTTSGMILAAHWRTLDFRSAWRLILASLAGIPFGLLLLQWAPERIINAVLGVMLVAYGIYNLLPLVPPKLGSEKYAFPFGFVAGILGAAYNTNGPPIVIYATLRRWPPSESRATLQGYFFFTNVLIVIGHGLAQLWTPEVFRLYFYSLPLIAVAVWAGGQVNGRISSASFFRGVYLFLIVAGILFLVRSGG